MRRLFVAGLAVVGAWTAEATAEPLSPAALRNELGIAHSHVRRGDYALAAKVYRALFADHISEDRVVRGYAGALRSMGRLDEALAAFAEGDQHRDPPRFVRERVSILRQLGRPADALDLCFEGIVANPGLEQLLRNDILQLAEMDDLGDRARDHLSDVFDDEPSIGVGETLVELSLAAEEFDDALSTTLVLDGIEPGRDGFRIFDLARRLGALGEERRSLAALDEMQERHPDAGRLRDAALFRAELYERLGEAKKAYENLTAYADGMSRVDQRSYDVHMQRARLLSGPLERVDEALAIYDELLGNSLLRPRHEAIRLQRAEVQLILARYGGAMGDFRELAGESRSASVRERAEFLIGEIFFYQGELDSAAAAWARQVDTFPKGDLANDALGRIFLFNENYGDAGIALREYGQVARLETEGDVAGAAARADSLLGAYAPEDGEPHLIVDDLLMKTGALWVELEQPDRALGCFEAVTTSHPESRLAPRAMMAAGQIVEIRDAPRALEMYEELILRYPLSIEASEVRPRVTRLRKEVRS